MASPSISVSLSETEINQSRKVYLDLILTELCKSAGCTYIGIQRYGEEPLVLFNSRFGSSLALPLAGISGMAIAIRCLQSDRQFQNAPAEPEPAAPSLKLACLIYNDLNADGQREWNEIISNYRTVRSKTKRSGEKGFILLTEILVVLLILVLSCFAIPNLVQISWNNASNDARARVQQVSNIRTAVIVCQNTPSCTPNPALLALLPANNSRITTQGYLFVMDSTGESFSAAPVLSSSRTGQPTYSFDASGVVSCTIGGVPCQQ